MTSEQSAIQMNRSMAPGVIIPEFAYPDLPEAVDWLCRVFGFVERLRIANHRAQLSLVGGSIVVTDGWIDPEAWSSERSLQAGGINHSVMVRVADADRHFEHAKQSGARIISPPTDYPYGERQYTAEDIAGRRWTFSQSIADVDPSDWGGTLVERG